MRHFFAIETAYPENYVHVFTSAADRNAWVAEKPTNREETKPTDARVRRSIYADHATAQLIEPGHYQYIMVNPTHWIGMAGLHGYLPATCGAYETARAAIDSLCETHDLSTKGRVARELSKYGTAELPEDAGNEYASVESCDCSTPWIHDEYDTPDNWPDYPQPDDA